MFRSEEIKVVEDWRWVWWDLESDSEFMGSATGTVMRSLRRRHIQSIYGRMAHISDDGELEIMKKDCDPFHVWVCCKACGKEILAEI